MNYFNHPKVDFMHVGTYIPFTLLMFRVVAIFFFFVFLVQFDPGDHIVFIVGCTLVYLDKSYFEAEPLNQGCGYLAPCAVAFFVNHLMSQQTLSGTKMGVQNVIVYYVVSVSWATCSMLLLASVYTDITKHPKIGSSTIDNKMMTFFTSLVGIAGVSIGSTPNPTYELCIRIIVFYIMTTCILFVRISSRHLQHLSLDGSIKQIGLHIMFVDMYVALVSFFLFVMFSCLCIRFNSNKQCCQEINMESQIFKKQTNFVEKSDEKTLKELLAAKRENSLV